MAGLIAYGTYLPHHRLQRASIRSVLGTGGGKGTRAVASFDEDAASMGVEAARTALRGVDSGAQPTRLLFTTTSPPYLDKTNATLVHAALNLPRSTLAVDALGSQRSSIGAMLAAAESREPALAVMSDLRGGMPGGADERDGGDGAAAILFGPGSPEAPVLAELVTVASTTDEFLDRWRAPGADASRVWEERFGEHVYGPLAQDSFTDAVKRAEVTPDDVDHLIVTGLHARAVKQFSARAGVRPEALADDLTGVVGNTGAAHPALLLAHVLDGAAPGALIALVVLADGATTLLLRTTDALAKHPRPLPSVATQAASGDDSLAYATFLTWRGHLDREPVRRPDPEAPAAPPTHRSERWKYAFEGSRCLACGTISLPPANVCFSCRAVDRTEPYVMADGRATIATFTIDRLAFTPSPPMVAAVLDFEGGGRFRCELTDVSADAVAIGDRVEMTFRRLGSSGGVHNYFWKARPARPQQIGA
jgi:3-hydroxy-3-methylglutaryl CoA synthase/uncharacterized OB-fold protein